jgi:signal transduction histidine kinase
METGAVAIGRTEPEGPEMGRTQSGRPKRRRPRAWILVACLAPLPVLSSLLLGAGSARVLGAIVISGLVLVVAALARAVQRNRRERLDYENRLAAWAADRAVTQERLRIARDLHDISSHGLGIITVRAASTGYLTGPDADAECRRAMRDIERISRSTTAELRRMLTLLRGPGDEPAPLRPADTLATLPGIVEDAERNGLIVRLTTTGLGNKNGRADGIGPSIQLTACAVVREALANALRHAGPTTAEVLVARNGDAIAVDIHDDGPVPGWRDAPGAGRGLTGLRERLAAQGGALTASRTGQGFHVHADIPLDRAVLDDVSSEASR